VEQKDGKYGDSNNLEHEANWISERIDMYSHTYINGGISQNTSEKICGEQSLHRSVLTMLYLYLPWGLRHIGGRSWVAEGVLK
jgi:hypothetical protein